MIEFRSVQKAYNKTIAIKGASFRIEKGEFVFFIGPSGAGKSTLLKMAYKAETPTNGSILIFHKDIKKMKTHILRQHIGIVFQDFENTLLKNKTAYENVAYVLESLGKSPFAIKKQTLDALDTMGILGKSKNYPHQLSGGEKQRVAIARAIVNRPDLLICDEPTGNLDAENADTVMHYLNALNKEGATVLMSTHNENIIAREKKRVIAVEDGRVREKNDGDRYGLDIAKLLTQKKSSAETATE